MFSQHTDQPSYYSIVYKTIFYILLHFIVFLLFSLNPCLLFYYYAGFLYVRKPHIMGMIVSLQETICEAIEIGLASPRASGSTKDTQMNGLP